MIKNLWASPLFSWSLSLKRNYANKIYIFFDKSAKMPSGMTFKTGFFTECTRVFITFRLTDFLKEGSGHTISGGVLIITYICFLCSWSCVFLFWKFISNATFEYCFWKTSVFWWKFFLNNLQFIRTCVGMVDGMLKINIEESNSKP